MKIFFLKLSLYIISIILLISALFYGVIFFKGEDLFISSLKNKNYFLIKVFLKVNPKLIDTTVEIENSNAFDYGIRKNDIKLLKILEPYTKSFNRHHLGERSIGYGLMWHSQEAIEYLLKNDLIRLKADYEGYSYQNYLNFLLACTIHDGVPASDNSRYGCAKLLMQMGADPFFRHQNIGLSNSIIIRCPEYLIDAFEKDGIKTCNEMEVFIKEVVKNYLEQFTQEKECFRLDLINRIIKVLNSLEKKHLKEDDAKVISEFKKYIIEDLKTMKNKKDELLVRPPYRSPFAQ